MGAAHVQGFAPDALRWGRPCSCQLANHPYLFQSIDAPIWLRRICLSSCQIRVLVRVIGFCPIPRRNFRARESPDSAEKLPTDPANSPKLRLNVADASEAVRVLPSARR